MFYEKKVSGYRALSKEIEALDSDAGIRIAGRVDGTAAFVFVTRAGRVFTAMCYERRGNPGRPGRLLTTRTFTDSHDLGSFIKDAAGARLTASVY
jgi:hypothetical protein